jgi:hypothetical protein
MCVSCVHVQLEQAVLKLYLSRYGESNYGAIMRVREMWIARYRNGTLCSAELSKFAGAFLFVCVERTLRGMWLCLCTGLIYQYILDTGDLRDVTHQLSLGKRIGFS